MIWDPRWDSLDPLLCQECGEGEALLGSTLCDECAADEAMALGEQEFWTRWLGDLQREADLGGPRDAREVA